MTSSVFDMAMTTAEEFYNKLLENAKRKPRTRSIENVWKSCDDIEENNKLGNGNIVTV